MEHPASFNIMVTDTDGTEKTYRVVLDAGKTVVSIEDFVLQPGSTYRITVEESEGSIVTLKQIDYYR